jgi:hypothetical protein
MNPKDEVPITEYQTLAEFRYQLRRFLRFLATGSHPGKEERCAS